MVNIFPAFDSVTGAPLWGKLSAWLSSTFATLDSPALTGTPTVNGQPIGGGGGALTVRIEAGALVITDADALGAVTAQAPTFTDESETANDTYTIPTVAGVEYLVGGSVVGAGTYPGSGTVTVSARGAQGYVLEGTSSWSYTFSAQGATYAEEVTLDGALAYYPLDDAAAPAVDATGNTSQSYLAGVTFGAAGLGDGATSADFAGTAGLLTTTYAPLVGVVSMEALVRLDAVGSTARAIATITDGVGDERMVLRVSTTGVLEWLGYYSTGSDTVTGVTTLTAGVTYHLAMVLLPTGYVRLFVNGAVDKDEWTQANIPKSPTTPSLSIGYRAGEGAFTTPLDGKLAGVAVYDSALTDAQVAAHALAAGVTV